MDNTEKKQVLLRLNQTTYDALVRWANDDFRSVNGQIEYILSRAVARREKPDTGEGTAQDAPDKT